MTPPAMLTAANATGMGEAVDALPPEKRRAVILRSVLIAVIAFLTVIDLFGSQALLPTLVEVYGVSPAAMGFAVNASTIGMAAASLAVAVLSHRIDRSRGIWISLALLSLPTAALAYVDSLAGFAALRIAQGVFMATAFTLTLTFLSERCTITAIGGAMAAYITGNVASNLVGRLMASGIAGAYGLQESFLAFAALNLAGAALAWRYFGGRPEPARPPRAGAGMLDAWGAHFANPALRAGFAIGFVILFVFVGVFTYANFVIAMPPFGLPQMYIGYVYFVFLPAILTTPVAATLSRRIGPRPAFRFALGAAVLGLGCLLVPSLTVFLAGLALIGAGLFFAQSVATAHIGRTAERDHAAANGLYLAAYYTGGMTGALVVGQVYAAAGWPAAIVLLAALCLMALWLGRDFAGAPQPAPSPSATQPS